MSSLIAWPASLTHFDFEYQGLYTPTFNYDMIEGWLLVHRDTLKDVRIGSVSCQKKNRVFNAALFPNLEFLKLSQQDILDSMSAGFSVEHLNLLGPKLKTIAWCWCQCGETEASWLRKFVDAAITHKAALKKVDIEFESYDWDCKIYPWDLMDAIRDQAMIPYGLELVYNEPTMPKHLWLAYQKDGYKASLFERGIYYNPYQENRIAGIGVVRVEEEEEYDTDDYLEQVQLPSECYGQDIQKYFSRRS
jgi:hypothetical protein